MDYVTSQQQTGNSFRIQDHSNTMFQCYNLKGLSFQNTISVWESIVQIKPIYNTNNTFKHENNTRISAEVKL